MVKANDNPIRWELTPEVFEALLARLHSDREQAGLAYEALRLRLTYFFEARANTRPDISPDNLVDKTVNRLAHQIHSGEDVRAIEPFALAIARYIWLEAHKEKAHLSLEEMLENDELQLVSQQPYEESQQDERIELMRQCVMRLPEDQLALLQEYYQIKAEDRRKLASKLGLSENALYLKIHRLRQRLATELKANQPKR